MPNFNKAEFARLLKLAKGHSRSINKYGLQSNVDPGYISRLLRGLVDSAPLPATIRKLAENAYNGITYEDLMGAAGHLKLRPSIFDQKDYELTPKEIDELLQSQVYFGSEAVTEEELAPVRELVRTYLEAEKKSDGYYHLPITLREVIDRLFNNHLLNSSQRQQLISKLESLVLLDTPYLIFSNNPYINKNVFIEKSGLKQLGINTIDDLSDIFETIFFEEYPHLRPEAMQKRLNLSLIEDLTGDKLGDWVKLIEKANRFNISPQELMPVLEIIHRAKKNNK